MPDDVRRLPGADAVLAAHAPAVPQPDQLCGPFAARLALHAVLADPPGLVELAQAAGTRIWPHDVPGERPPGAPSSRAGWERLPEAENPEDAGTDATGLAGGMSRLCPDVAVLPAGAPQVSGDVARLLDVLAGLAEPVGVLANLRTGPVAPAGMAWDVGHFVVVWGVADGEQPQVAVADSYAEVGAAGWPPGCRPVAATSLAAAVVGRGLLLLAERAASERVANAAADAGFSPALWAT